MANPLTIATVAFTALAGVAGAYFKDTEKETKSATKKLEEHAAMVKAAIDAWGAGAPRGLLDYNDELERTLRLEKQRAGLGAVIANEMKPARIGVENLEEAFAAMLGKLDLVASPDKIGLIDNLTKSFKTMQQAAKDGTITVEEVDQALKDLKTAQEEIGKVRGMDQLRAAFENLRSLVANLNTELKGTRDALQNVGKASQEFGALGALGAITSEGGQFRFPETDLKDWNDQGEAAGEAWMSGLYGHLAAGQSKSHIDNLGKDFAERLNAFFQSAPGRIEIFSGARSIERQAELFKAAVKKYGSPEAARKWVAPPGKSKHNIGEAADLRFQSEAVKKWAHDNAEAYGLVFRLSHEGWHVELADQEKVRSSRAKTFDETVAKMQAEIEQRRALNAINGDTTLSEDQRTTALQRQQAAAEQAKIAEQLLTAAKNEGKTITPELTAQINALAAAYADAGLKTDQLAVQSKKSAEATKEIAAQYEAFGNVAQNAVRGLVDALADGKLEGKELVTVISQIADQLIDLALSNIFSGGGAAGGLFGALFGGIGAGIKHAGGTAGGFGPSRRVSAIAFAGAQRFHSGGMAGIRPGEIPAILQRGEMVLPQGARMGGSSVVVNNYSKAEVQAREQPGGKGFEVIIEERIADRINTRGTPANKAVRSARRATSCGNSRW